MVSLQCLPFEREADTPQPATDEEGLTSFLLLSAASKKRNLADMQSRQDVATSLGGAWYSR